MVPSQGGTIIPNNQVNNYTSNYNVAATYGNQPEGSVAQELRLMSKLNK